jgi:hypothetical protein
MNTPPRASITDRLADRPVTPPPKPASGTATVTVASKLVCPLTLSVYAFEDFQEPSPNGHSRPARRAVELIDKRVTIRGTGQPGMPAGAVNPHTFNGYAITEGVPEEVWLEWLKTHEQTDLVKRRIVFATASVDRGKAEAREYENVRTGLEPVTPAPAGQRITDPRIERARLSPMTFDRKRS